MAVAFVKNVGSATLSMETSKAVTVPAAGVASGTFLVVRVILDTGGTLSLADTGGNTYTVREGPTDQAGTRFWIATAPVATALSSGDTITLTTAKATGGFVVDQFSGVGAFDVGNSAVGNSATPSVADTPTGIGLVFGGLGIANASVVVTDDSDSTGGGTWQAGLTQAGTGRKTAGQYKITTSAVTQTYNPTLASAQDWIASIVAFTEESTGPTATGALTLPAVTVSGTGAEVFTATGAAVLPAVTVSGTGHHPHQGTGALTLPTVTVEGTGAEVFTATGAIALAAVTVSGDGIHTNEKIATGALTLPSVTVEGTGAQAFTATGAVVLGAATVAGTGTEVFTSTGEVALPTVSIVGTGAEVFTATGAVGLPTVTLDGTALHISPVTGTGALSLAGLSVAGTGTHDDGTAPEVVTGGFVRRRRPEPQRVVITGAGALLIPSSLVAGRGVTFDDDIRWLLPPELVLAGAI